MRKFFNDKIEPRCEYCERGFLSADGKNVMCKKKGVVELGFSCSSFVYDPIQREPKRAAPPIPEFDPDEFKL